MVIPRIVIMLSIDLTHILSVKLQVGRERSAGQDYLFAELIGC